MSKRIDREMLAQLIAARLSKKGICLPHQAGGKTA